MAARTLVKQVAAAVDRLVPPPDGIVVLIYHRVGGGSASEVDLDVDVFSEQMAHLAERHRVFSLDDAVEALVSGDPVGGVVVTFDDGTTDFAEHVVPILVDHRVPATLYVATRFVDEQEEFPWGAPPITWAALRDAASTGLITIGSHTHAHWLMDRLEPTMIAEDLDRSIDLIGEHVGTRPEHFAYPKALPGSPEAEIAVRRRFRSAALAANRVNRPGRTDLHRIWRTPVQRADGNGFFAAKAAGGLRLEGELRSIVSRVKYRGMSR